MLTRAGQTLIAVLIAAFAAIMTVTAPTRAMTTEELVRGFNLTVFGAEFTQFGFQTRYIRKFAGPVRFQVVNLAKRDRSREVERFIRSLNGSIAGLRAVTTNNPTIANFRVFIVDQADYKDVARKMVFKRPGARVPGRCLVRSVFSPAGIVRSDAVVVADAGEALFKRCMIEEILQGLGPLNEHPSLGRSVFNDRTRHTSFTRFDRIIMNSLYDRRIRNGATITEVQAILPQVVSDARRRVR